MDLGTAPLFDLTAPATEVVDPVAVSRSQELLVEIRGDQTAIAEREISKLRRIAEWRPCMSLTMKPLPRRSSSGVWTPDSLSPATVHP